MEEAQDAMGVDPHEFVPVTYLNEVAWGTELARLAPTLLLLAGFVFLNRRMGGMPGMGGPGGGGPGGGIFNVGKASITTLDKNAKHKIMFKDVAGCDEAKAEIMEFVDFLKKPKKYEDLGAKIPRGALLVGPRGRARRSSPRRPRASLGFRFCPYLALTSWRCSWAWARAGSAISSHRPGARRRASSSSTRLTPSVASAGAAG